MGSFGEPAAADGRLRVLLADDDDLYRAALTMSLEQMPFVEVVGRARDGQEAVELFAELRPELVILDLAMPRLNGFQAIEQIRRIRPETNVIVVSSTADHLAFGTSMRLGARACSRKDTFLLAVATVGDCFFATQ